jgi:hypothetical protein
MGHIGRIAYCHLGDDSQRRALAADSGGGQDRDLFGAAAELNSSNGTVIWMRRRLR